MADVVSAIRSFLLSKTAVTDLIGQRLYLDRLEQGCDLPAATIEKSSGTHDHTLSDRSGFVKARLSLRCFSPLRLTANSIAEKMYQSGVAAIKGVTNSVDIRGVMVEDGQRNYIVGERDGSDDPLYVTEFDLMVSYRE